MDPKNFRRVDLEPAPENFLGDVLEGLSGRPKSLSPKYCYDALGSHYFEEIAALEEYYPTRTELTILDGLGRMRLGQANALAVIELGGASSFKFRRLMPCLDGLDMYVPVDISRDALFGDAERLALDHPELEVLAICADYQQLASFPWGESIGDRTPVIFFPGSTIGNLSEVDAVALMKMCRRLAGDHGFMLLGSDLVKAPEIILPAYDDSKGANARFNLNVLHRINRELGGNLRPETFRHDVRYDEAKKQIDIHLVSLLQQEIRIGERVFAFAAGERMHVESSRKFERQDLERLADETGFRCTRFWTDPRHYYGVLLLEAKASAIGS